jgi:tetratricopeptide (TPR) repeat protein
MKDASFWFVKALRLHIEAESSILTSSDEALGMDGFALLNKHAANGSTAQEQTIREETVATETPLVKHLPGSEPPMSNVICAVKTPSGQSIAASTLLNVTFNSSLSDAECIDRCKDVFWEPTIYNLGQSYRKLKQFSDAILCFEKCVSLNPGNAAAYAALGFARHLSGDIDSAIDSYHEALSRKPDDPFSSEMLNRALAEAVTYPKSSVFASSYFDIEHQTSAIGSSILANIAKATYSQGVIPGQSVMTSNDMDIAIG